MLKSGEKLTTLWVDEVRGDAKMGDGGIITVMLAGDGQAVEMRLTPELTKDLIAQL